MTPKMIPADLTGKALFDFVVKNEAIIIHAKKSEIKHGDGFCSPVLYVDDRGKLANKAEAGYSPVAIKDGELQLSVVINTTNWFDSHMDVHIPGIWDKTVKDNYKNGLYLLNYHKATHEDVIGEGLKPSVVNTTWKDLGYNYNGTTQALFFNGKIYEDRNPGAFKAYRNGEVKQHSVGMRYIKMVTCINDEDYPVQKENWDKYAPMVTNIKDAEDNGVFWAILEAQANEGSKVLFGSNPMTPDMTPKNIITEQQPVLSTAKQPIDYSKTYNFLKQLKLT